jgi:hypothetical protein
MSLWLAVATLMAQIVLIGIITASAWFAIRTRKHIAATLEALHAYRREVAWFEARLDALEKKNAEKNWKVIEGSNGRPDLG